MDKKGSFMADFELFKKHIINGRFYEAHEVLEEYWHTVRKADNPYKNAYRGFINAAVAMELKKRGRRNYGKVWENFEKYRDIYIKNEKFKDVMNFLYKYNPCK